MLTLLLLWSLIIFLALLRWMQITPASWGRLLFPSLPALAILSAWSLTQFGFWILDFGLRITHYALRPITLYALRFTLYFPWLLPLLLFTLSLISPFRYLQVAYGKTPLMAETDIPAEGFQRLDFFYEAERLRLVGYRVEKSQVEPGDWLPVTLYWQATRPVGKNYTTFVHLLDREGESIGQANTYPDGGNWPTSMLPPGGVLASTYYVPVSPEAEAPQLTRLAFGLFEFEDPARAAKAAVNGAGEPVEPVVEGVPLLPRQWPVLTPGRRLEANFGGQIRLTGYDPIGEKRIRPGTQVPITFYWEALAAPGRNLNLFIHLIDPATRSQIAGFDGPPPYPTRFWQPGQTFIDARLLSLPAGLPPGDYELWVGWYSLDDFARLPLLDQEGDALRLVTVTVKNAAAEKSRD